MKRELEMRLTGLNGVWRSVAGRASGFLLVSSVVLAPSYLLIWHSELIDDLSVRVFVTSLVAIFCVLELFAEQRPWKERRYLIYVVLFLVLVGVLAIGRKYNLDVLASNAAVAVAILPWVWLIWLLLGRSGLLLTCLIAALVALMIYWIAALSRQGGPPEILLLPVWVVAFGGIFWAPVARLTLSWATRSRERPLLGPATEALAMATMCFPITLIAVVFPDTLKLPAAWSEVSLTIVGVLLSAVIAKPVRQIVLGWGSLAPD